MLGAHHPDTARAKLAMAAPPGRGRAEDPEAREREFAGADGLELVGMFDECARRWSFPEAGDPAGPGPADPDPAAASDDIRGRRLGTAGPCPSSSSWSLAPPPPS